MIYQKCTDGKRETACFDQFTENQYETFRHLASLAFSMEFIFWVNVVKYGTEKPPTMEHVTKLISKGKQTKRLESKEMGKENF